MGVCKRLKWHTTKYRSLCEEAGSTTHPKITLHTHSLITNREKTTTPLQLPATPHSNAVKNVSHVTSLEVSIQQIQCKT
jgi:hypothetical protein